MSHVLIVYGTSEGQTEKVAHRLRDRLHLQGHEADAFRADRFPADLDPLDYDGVLVGGSIHGGRYQKPLLAWARAHEPSLAARPSALFTVCMRAAEPTDAARREVGGYVAGLVRETGWQPAETVAFAGALRYSAYNLLLRWVMRRIARKAAAHLPGATDTSRDHEYTDWAAVDAFADAFAHRLVAAEAQEPAAVR
ncbi:MAG TPA: flavodoxin domain-containing protein [Rubricoccaceae bacterium]|jgi:menaquinone-dependent protoporphyrinogen oxidase|nr:flavodoxin domain-containing protein [Rubricoccaceae bacterium]